ncbi:lanC-like protein 1 [Gigaspora margarita]|uniref:LanC-like protein 1 n=3 Tax=Gigaspora margarita TaxID=4874 RepID=A0A8H3XD23_GIGMA|nr:lanC-like protein 1 [Gigaspora margarita]
MPERYLQNSLTLPNIDDCDPAIFEKFIRYGVEKILSNFPATYDSRHYDVFVGYGGVAFMFFHLHQLFPDLTIAGDKVSLLCSTYLSASLSAVHNTSLKHLGFIGSHIGPLALAVVFYETIEKNTIESSKYLDIIDQYHSLLIQEDSNEVLYGRAGYIYALIFIRKYCKDNEEIMSKIGDKKLKEIIKLIIKDGRDGAKKMTVENLKTVNDKITKPALMWSWHNAEYIGAIHGVAGIIATILQCGELAHPYLDELLQTTEWLAELVQSNKNYPARIQSTHDDLIQFCHGAPGILVSFLKIYSLYPTHTSSKNILSNAIAKTDLVWECGILKKGVTGLCHNTLGNAYAFLLTYLITRDEVQLRRALAFGLYGGEWEVKTHKNEERVSDHPWSLFEGLGGGIIYWSDLMFILKNVKQLGVNSESVAQGKVIGFPCFTDL